MNVPSITQYVALLCLLVVLAFSPVLQAQTKAEGCGKTVAVVCKAVATTATEDGGTVEGTEAAAPVRKHEVRVVTVNGGGTTADGAPTHLVVKKTTENGKTRMFVNGKEVEGDAADLPDHVQTLLSTMPTSIALGGVTSPDAEGDVTITDRTTQVYVFSDTADGKSVEKHLRVYGMAPNCKMWTRDSACSFRFDFKFDNEAMQQQCEEMKQLFSKMRLDTAAWREQREQIREKLRSLRNLHVDMPPVMAPLPPMMIMNGDEDVVISIPETPSVRSFETDDLDEVRRLYNVPEIDTDSDAPTFVPAPDGQKRYRVIIIERPDGDNEEISADKAVDADIVVEETVEETTVPSDVRESLFVEYFNVYPNPTPGALNISFALVEPGAVTVTVTDLLGNSVFSDRVEQISGQYYRQIDMDAHPRGTYIVRIEQNGQVLSRQVAVQ